MQESPITSRIPLPVTPRCARHVRCVRDAGDVVAVSLLDSPTVIPHIARTISTCARSTRWCVALAGFLFVAAAAMGRLDAQGPPQAQGQLQAGGQIQPGPEVAQALATATVGEPAVLRYFNRPIITLRAVVLSRQPEERAARASVYLKRSRSRRHDGPGLDTACDGRDRSFQWAAGMSSRSHRWMSIRLLARRSTGRRPRQRQTCNRRSTRPQSSRTRAECSCPRGMALLATAVLMLLLWLLRRAYRALAVRLPEPRRTQAPRSCRRATRSWSRRHTLPVSAVSGDRHVWQAWRCSSCIAG